MDIQTLDEDEAVGLLGEAGSCNATALEEETADDPRRLGIPSYFQVDWSHRMSRKWDDPLLVKPAPGRFNWSLDPEEGFEDSHIIRRLTSGCRLTTATNQLTELEAVCILTVLESIVDILIITGHIGNLPEPTLDIDYFSLDERYGEVRVEKTLIDPETNETTDLDSAFSIFRKIHTERAYLKYILSETLNDLCGGGHYATLSDSIIQNLLVESEEEELEKELKKNVMDVKKLKTEIMEHNKSVQDKLIASENKLSSLINETHDFIVVSSMEMRYVNKWENARIDQHHMALNKTEKDLMKKLSNLKLEMEHDVKANSEIMEFLTQDTEHLENEILKWTEKQHVDGEKIDLDTKMAKADLEEMTNKNKELAKLFLQRQQALDEYEEEKERRRLEEQQQILRNAMAKRIQLWWRAILLRRRIRALRRRGKVRPTKAENSKK